MPGMDGIEATRRIKDAAPDTKVILITVDESRGAVSEAIQAGVSGYLLKDATPDALVDAARNAVEGNAVIHPQLTKTFIEEARTAGDEPKTDPAVQARTRDPPEGRRRRHHSAGRLGPRDLAAYGEDPPRAHLREARRERPCAGGGDRDPHRHRALSPSVPRSPDTLNPVWGGPIPHQDGRQCSRVRRGRRGRVPAIPPPQGGERPRRRRHVGSVPARSRPRLGHARHHHGGAVDGGARRRGTDPTAACLDTGDAGHRARRVR